MPRNTPYSTLIRRLAQLLQFSDKEVVKYALIFMNRFEFLRAKLKAMAAEEQKNVLDEDGISEVQSDGEIFTDDAHEGSLKADIGQSDLVSKRSFQNTSFLPAMRIFITSWQNPPARHQSNSLWANASGRKD